MEKLDENFFLEKYGLKVRLVNECDADFIVSLRSDPNKTKYMITLDNEVDTQRIWIQDYKKREKKGLDYYFIYSNIDNNPIGLNRISHVDYIEKTAKASSWITVGGLINEAFKMSIILSEIAFNLLKVDMFKFEVHKKNSSLIRFYKLLDCKYIDNGTDYYYYTSVKNDFLKIYDKNLTKMLLLNM